MVYTHIVSLYMDDDSVSFGKQITFARQRSQYTSHEFAQLMGIKLRVLEDYENDVTMPEKKHITKMNRFLTKFCKLPYPKQM